MYLYMEETEEVSIVKLSSIAFGTSGIIQCFSES